MYLLIDIGGTKTRLAISPDGQSLGEVEIIPTDPDFSKHLAGITKTAQAFTSSPTQAAVCGLPGVLDQAKSVLVRTPHLPHWEKQPIQQQLSKIFNCPVFLANDADLAGLGEAAVGAGQSFAIVAYLTISTGVGGSRIVNQKIDDAAQGFEPGHQIIKVEEGKKLSLEDCVSGSGLQYRYGLPGEQITDPAVWHKVTEQLAIGLHNVTVLWSPHCIILGGAVMQSIDLAQLKEQLAKTLTIFPALPDIKLAAFKEASALHGALVYLRDVIK